MSYEYEADSTISDAEYYSSGIVPDYTVPYGEGDIVILDITDDDLMNKLKRINASIDNVKKIVYKNISFVYLLGIDTSEYNSITTVLTTELGGGSDVVYEIFYRDNKVFTLPLNPFQIVTKAGNSGDINDYSIDNGHFVTVYF